MEPPRVDTKNQREREGAGMKGMEQVDAGSTRLIQQGKVLISEMESLPKQNLLPWCLPAASA